MKRGKWIFATALAAMMLAGNPAWAQDDDAEGPGRGVARISLLNGDVSVRRGDSGDWVAAAINAPLLAEDRVFSGAGSRAEIQFDYYHRIRLAEETEIRLAELEQQRYQIQVARGTVTFSALEGGDAQVEISTPGASVRPVAYGRYRVTVLPDGTAEVTVRQGEAEIFTPSGSQRLRPGRTMQVRVIGEGRSEFQLVGAIPNDAWDEFNERRDRDLRRSKSYQYVSRDIYGAEELDNHGSWTYVAPYGWSWRPYVAVGWAPYRYGRWAWVDWYGWTWVSYDPWGWAPYHYGRWFNWGGHWHWYPGHMGHRHHWRPGLVAFFGWNSWGGVNFGFGYGRWGWVPLAPFEPYYPWYGSRWYGGFRNRTYVDNSVRIVNNINVTNVYRNARLGNAVTVVDSTDFSRGRVGRALRVDNNELSRASLMRGALPVAPERESLRLADREVRAQSLPRASGSGNERFYSRREAARVDRVPFEEQRRTLEQVSRRAEFGGDGSRRAESPRQVETERGNAVRAAEGERNAVRSGETGRSADAGWRRVNEPTRSVDIGRGEPVRTQTGAEDGWRRFGEPRGTARASAEESGRSGRSSELPARSTERSAEAESRTGWRSFGNPATSGRSEPATRTGGDEGWRSFGAGQARSGDTGRRAEDSRVELPRAEGPRTEAPRSDSPRMDTGRWSTRGESGRSEGQRMETQRSEPARGQMPQIINGSGPARTESPRTGDGQRAEPRAEPRQDTPRDRGAEPAGRGGRERGNDTSYSTGGMSRSERWSTGGNEGMGRSAGSWATGNSGAWSTGRSEPASGTRGGEWSAGASRSESRSGSPSWSTGGGMGAGPGTYRGGAEGTGSRGGGIGAGSTGGIGSPRGGDFGGRSGGGGIGAPRSGGSFGGGRTFSAPSGRGDFGGGGARSGGGFSSGGGMRGGGSFGGSSGSIGGSSGRSGGSSGGGIRGGGGGAARGGRGR